PRRQAGGREKVHLLRAAGQGRDGREVSAPGRLTNSGGRVTPAPLPLHSVFVFPGGWSPSLGPGTSSGRLRSPGWCGSGNVSAAGRGPAPRSRRGGGGPDRPASETSGPRRRDPGRG